MILQWLFTHTPLYLMTQSFWQDEAFSYFMARLPLSQLLERTATDFNPPLYYILLKVWMHIFGTSEAIMRSLSLVFFALNLYVVYLFLRQIMKVRGRRIWVYIVLFAINPFLVYYAFEARMYSLFALLATVSFYFFLRKKWKYYYFFTVLGLYTHYFFMFVVLTQLIFLFITEKRIVSKSTKFIYAAVLTFSPWLFYAVPKFIADLSTSWIWPFQLKNVLELPGILYTGYEPHYYTFYDPYIGILSLLITLIVAFFFFHKKLAVNRNLLLLILWALMFFFLFGLVSLVKPLFVPRYLIFAPIGFMFFLFYIMENCDQKIATVLILLLFLSALHYTTYETAFKKKGDIRKVVHEIKTISNEGDSLYVADPVLYFTAAYYYGNSHVYIYRRADEVPNYIGLALISPDKIRRDLPVYPQKAFILKNESEYEIKSVM